MTEDLPQRILDLRRRIAGACGRAGRDPSSVRVVVVTKTHPAPVAQAVIDAGIPDIGENRVQEIVEKAGSLTGGFSLHLVGHLQTNKIGKLLPLVQWIQSIDSARLVDAIDARAAQVPQNRGRINALVQVNTSGEPSKSGCTPDECRAVCERVARSPLLALRGLMTIGPFDAGEAATRASFALLRRLRDQCAGLAGSPLDLSMGMSGDFEWAIEEGATIIRVGTMLLGTRQPRSTDEHHAA